MRARKPNNFLILTLLGSVLYGGCVLPGDDSGLTPPPCDCPNLEAAVDSINWVSGLGVSTIEMSRGPEGLAIQYVWDVNLGDPSVDLVELWEALIRTGFMVEEQSDFRIMARLDRLGIWAGTNEQVEDRPASIFVRVTYQDEDSPEVAVLLEPFRSALAE